MATIVPTSSDNSGIGVVLGILLAIVLAVAAYFFFVRDGGPATSSTTNIDLPDVNVSAPATPGADNSAQ